MVVGELGHLYQYQSDVSQCLFIPNLQRRDGHTHTGDHTPTFAGLASNQSHFSHRVALDAEAIR